MIKGPEGKYIFGMVKVGERGQIVIPKDARELFGINAGDSLLVVGDVDQGIAIIKSGEFMNFALGIFNKEGGQDGSDKDGRPD